MTTRRAAAQTDPPQTRMRKHHRTWPVLAALWLHVAQPASAQNPSPAQVRDAIEAGKKSILNQIRTQDQITYKEGTGTKTVEGRVTSRSKDVIWFRTDKDEKLNIPPWNVVRWLKAGTVRSEMPAPCVTGPSTLAAVALATAGVEISQPQMALLISALEDQDGPGMGTYVHSLRAALWSSLLERPIGMAPKARFRKLLQRDANWLTTAPLPDGSYGYNAEPAMRGDHSNTQFADLGLWAAGLARIDISSNHWRRIARHWLTTQNRDGGWSYMPGAAGAGSTPSMTVAGCNSLYIALDRYYGRSDKPYVLFEGCPPNMEARKGIDEITDAIERGDAFLRKNPPDIEQSFGYELFGLERLGLASGQVYVGGRDWFRSHAAGVCRRKWSGQVVADSFALIFLVHGQSPVLFQKLQHGRSADDWNYYNRDLASLTRYLSRTFERLARWQRIPEDASVAAMSAAPLLYISSPRALELRPETLQRIRQYVDQGGTVFLHADRANQKFTRSARTSFEQLFKDRGLRFVTLPATHPVYSCYFGGSAGPWKRRPPLEAIADESRILAYLCPVDIAGAWQDEKKAFEDLFRIMANIRVYSAAPYAELPAVAEPADAPVFSTTPRGSLALLRSESPPFSAAHPLAWTSYAQDAPARIGLKLSLAATATPEDWARCTADIVHVSLSSPVQLNAQASAGLREYLEHGGLLLVDAPDGRPEAIAAVRDFANQLDLGEKGLLSADHPIIAGTMPGGRPLLGLETTDSGVGLVRGKSPPPIITRTWKGRIVQLACPFDLVGGLDHGFVWNRLGFRPESTRRLTDNLLLWRHEEYRHAARTRRTTDP